MALLNTESNCNLTIYATWNYLFMSHDVSTICKIYYIQASIVLWYSFYFPKLQNSLWAEIHLRSPFFWDVTLPPWVIDPQHFVTAGISSRVKMSNKKTLSLCLYIYIYIYSDWNPQSSVPHSAYTHTMCVKLKILIKSTQH